MIIISEKDKESILNFNKNIYENFESILILSLGGFGYVSENNILVKRIKNNTYNLILNNDEQVELQLKYGNEIYKECLILSNKKREHKYEINDMDLKLIRKKIFEDNYMFEISYYSYGIHINIVTSSKKLYMLDIQGKAAIINDLLFEEIIKKTPKITVQNLEKIVAENNVLGGYDRIFIEEYDNNNLTKKVCFDNHKVIFAKVLKKKKC